MVNSPRKAAAGSTAAAAAVGSPAPAAASGNVKEKQPEQQQEPLEWGITKVTAKGNNNNNLPSARAVSE